MARMARMTATQLKTTLENAGCDVDQVTYRNGEFTIRRGFFYTNGQTAARFASDVVAAIKLRGLDCVATDQGCKWEAFKGGAPVAKQSHFWVKITLTTTIRTKADLEALFAECDGVNALEAMYS